MSQGLRESLLSYQFSRVGRNRATSSSTDSLPSPGDSLRSRGSQPSSRTRPQLRTRPHSSGEGVYERIRVQTIEEGNDRASIKSTQQQTNRPHKVRSSEVFGVQSLKNTVYSVQRSKEQDETIGGPPHSPLHELPKTPTGSVEVKAKTSRPSWARTRSGGVWYRSQKSASSHADSSIRSGRSTPSKANQTEPASIIVVPLKPPPRPKILQISPTNHIVIEQPFGHNQESRHAPASTSTVPLAEDRRRSSIDVKRLFSTPLMRLRRSLADKSDRLASPSPERTPTSTNPSTPSGQKSLSKRDQIAATLDRVSALLEGQKRSNFKARIRTFSYKTVSSTSSSEPNEPRHSHTKALIGSSHFARNKLLEHVAEITSSIFNVHMGSTPRNSPTEKATYKVRRRPSAETEEFLKIDISIRGGTSYLASEARRISTPPLPDDVYSTGLRRGFFFDYNASTFDEACNKLHAGQHHSSLEIPDHHAHDSALKPDMGKRTTTNIHRSTSRKTAHEAKAGDWYDTQLADVDTATFDVNTTIPSQPSNHHHCRHECQAQLAELRRQQYEVQLDYDIPEHLPNSPLCPRNPRYWRVRQQKGSQFRGCWMHGFGEYGEVPGLVE